MKSHITGWLTFIFAFTILNCLFAQTDQWRLSWDMNSEIDITDYKIYRAGDLPEKIENILIENPQADGPYGARGIGEITMLGVPAAIGNALQNAVGIQINSLPLTAENIWQTIKEKRPELIDQAKKALKGGNL